MKFVASVFRFLFRAVRLVCGLLGLLVLFFLALQYYPSLKELMPRARQAAESIPFMQQIVENRSAAGDLSEASQSAAGPYTGRTQTVKLNGIPIEVHTSFKKSMDAYEEFFDEYVRIMNDPSPDTAKAMSFLIQYAEMLESFSAIKDEELSDGDALYYADVSLRIMQKLSAVGSEN